MDVAAQFSLTGKTAFITGAGGVLGGAIAEAYLASGVKVAISDIDADGGATAG